jgi:hypothetical protein
MTFRSPFAALLLPLFFCACAATDPAAPGDGTETDDLAATSGLTAHVPGMTVWLDPVAVADWRYEQWVWVIKGRTSKNLESAFSYSSDDEFGETLVTSKRKFEFVADGPSMVRLLEGYPLFIQIGTTTGTQKTYFATVHVTPRFGHFTGSSKIFVHDQLAPVLSGGRAVFRGTTSTAKGVELLDVAGPVARPEGTVVAPPNYASDWTWPNLLLAAEPPADKITFSATSSTGSFAKKAGIDIAVADLGLATTAPSIDAPCEPSVQACVEAQPGPGADLAACGTAAAVKACVWSFPPSPSRFSDDLTLWLGSWYSEHGADVASSGGNPLLTAQAAVHAAGAEEVTDPEADPHAHDLSKFVVYRHADVVWPGSDIAWFGAYDRATGQLQSIYDFN